MSEGGWRPELGGRREGEVELEAEPGDGEVGGGHRWREARDRERVVWVVLPWCGARDCQFLENEDAQRVWLELETEM